MDLLPRLTGIIGVLFVLAFAYAFSENRKAINWRIVGVGVGLQVALAIFILKVPLGQALFAAISHGITALLDVAHVGAKFVLGPLVEMPLMQKAFGPANGFVFAFQLIPTIIFVAMLVNIAYHLGLMQRVVKTMAWVITRLMHVSGLEALSNVASVFVGQIEAQLMIRPYIGQMTRSELMASMSGSLACIAGSIMAVYIQLGVSATYLLTASLMAAPGALVIAKMMLPETQRSDEEKFQTIELDDDAHQSVNLIDAAARGASDGMKIGLQVVTMLIAFISLIALIDAVLVMVGKQCVAWGANLSPMGIDLAHLSLQQILSIPFSGVAAMLGVPFAEAAKVGGLLGTKLVANEFVAYQGYLALQHGLSLKAQAIASVALCGFANFGSVAMQIGGIGEMAPNRKADLAQLGLKALVAGSLASYMSAAIVGMLL